MSVWDVLIRLTLATIIGGAIGYEREFKNRPAGFRTHILVCIGATLISLIQFNMGEEIIARVAQDSNLAQVFKVDYARMGAQVITGVGFLGAGTILHTKNSIKGLTTAASLWVVACLGLAIGMGYYSISILGALFIEITLWLLKKFQTRFITKAGVRKVEVHYVNKREAVEAIEAIFDNEAVKIRSIEFILGEDTVVEDDDTEEWCAIYTIAVPYTVDFNEIISTLSLDENILKISQISKK